MKAIETKYGGYHFRSRLEARWAVFFDTAGIKYEYEKEGYDLGSFGKYLPDFWLPEVYLRSSESPGIWCEVKGEKVSKEYSDMLMELARQTEKSLALVTGLPGIYTDTIGQSENGFEEFSSSGGWDNFMGFCKCYNCGTVKYEFGESSYMSCHKCSGTCDDKHPDLLESYADAKIARFEFKYLSPDAI